MHFCLPAQLQCCYGMSPLLTVCCVCLSVVPVCLLCLASSNMLPAVSRAQRERQEIAAAIEASRKDSLVCAFTCSLCVFMWAHAFA